MTIDKQALREAAEKYRTTYAAHLKTQEIMMRWMHG
ncbi:Uncharacterised protein [Citrobacter koseri]|nr:Uncharacterised protein [Citrobacter koseri]